MSILSLGMNVVSKNEEDTVLEKTMDITLAAHVN